MALTSQNISLAPSRALTTQTQNSDGEREAKTYQLIEENMIGSRREMNVQTDDIPSEDPWTIPPSEESRLSKIKSNYHQPYKMVEQSSDYKHSLTPGIPFGRKRLLNQPENKSTIYLNSQVS